MVDELFPMNRTTNWHSDWHSDIINWPLHKYNVQTETGNSPKRRSPDCTSFIQLACMDWNGIGKVGEVGPGQWVYILEHKNSLIWIITHKFLTRYMPYCSVHKIMYNARSRLEFVSFKENIPSDLLYSPFPFSNQPILCFHFDWKLLPGHLYIVKHPTAMYIIDANVFFTPNTTELYKQSIQKGTWNVCMVC